MTEPETIMEHIARDIREGRFPKRSESDQQRMERYKQGLANAIARLANSQHRPDWIAYNERQIAKYERLLSALTNEQEGK